MNELVVFVICNEQTGQKQPVDVVSRETFISFDENKSLVTALRLDERGQSVRYSFTFDHQCNEAIISILRMWNE